MARQGSEEWKGFFGHFRVGEHYSNTSIGLNQQPDVRDLVNANAYFLNDLMVWMDDMAKVHELNDSSYKPDGVSLDSQGFVWQVNSGDGTLKRIFPRLANVVYGDGVAGSVQPASTVLVANEKWADQNVGNYSALTGYNWNDIGFWDRFRKNFTYLLQKTQLIETFAIDGGYRDDEPGTEYWGLDNYFIGYSNKLDQPFLERYAISLGDGDIHLGKNMGDSGKVFRNNYLGYRGELQDNQLSYKSWFDEPSVGVLERLPEVMMTHNYTAYRRKIVEGALKFETRVVPDTDFLGIRNGLTLHTFFGEGAFIASNRVDIETFQGITPGENPYQRPLAGRFEGTPLNSEEQERLYIQTKSIKRFLGTSTNRNRGRTSKTFNGDGRLWYTPEGTDNGGDLASKDGQGFQGRIDEEFPVPNKSVLIPNPNTGTPEPKQFDPDELHQAYYCYPQMLAGRGHWGSAALERQEIDDAEFIPIFDSRNPKFLGCPALKTHNNFGEMKHYPRAFLDFVEGTIAMSGEASFGIEMTAIGLRRFGRDTFVDPNDEDQMENVISDSPITNYPYTIAGQGGGGRVIFDINSVKLSNFNILDNFEKNNLFGVNPALQYDVRDGLNPGENLRVYNTGLGNSQYDFILQEGFYNQSINFPFTYQMIFTTNANSVSFGGFSNNSFYNMLSEEDQDIVRSLFVDKALSELDLNPVLDENFLDNEDYLYTWVEDGDEPVYNPYGIARNDNRAKDEMINFTNYQGREKRVMLNLGFGLWGSVTPYPEFNAKFKEQHLNQIGSYESKNVSSTDMEDVDWIYEEKYVPFTNFKSLNGDRYLGNMTVFTPNVSNESEKVFDFNNFSSGKNYSPPTSQRIGNSTDFLESTYKDFYEKAFKTASEGAIDGSDVIVDCVIDQEVRIKYHFTVLYKGNNLINKYGIRPVDEPLSVSPTHLDLNMKSQSFFLEETIVPVANKDSFLYNEELNLEGHRVRPNFSDENATNNRYVLAYGFIDRATIEDLPAEPNPDTNGDGVPMPTELLINNIYPLPPEENNDRRDHPNGINADVLAPIIYEKIRNGDVNEIHSESLHVGTVEPDGELNFPDISNIKVDCSEFLRAECPYSVGIIFLVHYVSPFDGREVEPKFWFERQYNTTEELKVDDARNFSNFAWLTSSRGWTTEDIDDGEQKAGHFLNYSFFGTPVGFHEGIEQGRIVRHGGIVFEMNKNTNTEEFCATMNLGRDEVRFGLLGHDPYESLEIPEVSTNSHILPPSKQPTYSDGIKGFLHSEGERIFGVDEYQGGGALGGGNNSNPVIALSSGVRDFQLPDYVHPEEPEEPDVPLL